MTVADLSQVDRLGDRAWVTQCALSRVCGCCAMSLGRPVAFLGSAQEVALNAFHLPPMHLDCATELRAAQQADPDWELVTTAHFEFVRPGRDDLDRSVRFEPSELLGSEVEEGR